MKNIIKILIFSLIAINTYGQQASEIDPKFVKLPRYANLAAITNITTGITTPTQGMMVYNIGTASNWYYNGSAWKDMAVSSVSVPSPLYLTSTGTTIAGETNQADEAGVLGINTTTGVGYAVLGKATSTNPDEHTVGVKGENMSTNATGYGIHGTHSGTGVAGFFQGTNALETVGASKFGGNVAIQGSNTLELGSGIIGKQTDNGKIAYGAFGSPGELSIVGAGTALNGSDRKIKMWANAGTYFTGGATFNGNVGVGTNVSNQKLEVNGKIKISDDENTPVAGNIRYNTITNDFEGFNGTIWKSFTQPTGFWGTLNNVVSEVEASSVIPYGDATEGTANVMISDNYMAVLFKTSAAVADVVTKFYKWESNNWVYMHQLPGNLIGKMTDDWILKPNLFLGPNSIVSFSLYKRTANTWAFHSNIGSGLPGNPFGKKYDIDGDKFVVMLIGALGSTTNFIHIYKFNGTGWALSQTLTDPTPAVGNEFGTTLSYKKDFIGVGYDDFSPIKSIVFYKYNGTSFVGNSAITEKYIEQIYYDGTAVRVNAYTVDLSGFSSGGIYKVNTSGFWELIPNSMNLFNGIDGFILSFSTANSADVYTLNKVENGIPSQVCNINYGTLPNASTFGYPILNSKSIVIPSKTGYQIFKRP